MSERAHHVPGPAVRMHAEMSMSMVRCPAARLNSWRTIADASVGARAGSAGGADLGESNGVRKLMPGAW
jgi:hypothetical protein